MSASSAPAPSVLRRAASRIVPDSGKRTIDRVRARRYLQRMRPLNEQFVGRYGLEVRHGPFAGMQYLPGQERISGHLIAKLLGRYESQLYPWLEHEWIGGDFDLFVDVGCAEGYYAVGLARAMPGVTVRAYDTDRSAREQCAELAHINGLGERVLVGEECTPETLAALPAARVALLSDCEGYERTLLDPALAPNLRGWSIIVEQHDNVDPSISTTIRERFSATHEIATVGSPAADGTDVPELGFMAPAERSFVLEERPLPMTWALLRPRHQGQDAPPAADGPAAD